MTSPRVIYFGIKTQRSAAEVGGWSNVDQMGLKDALTYDTITRKYHNYTKSQITDIINHLQTADLIVGFNQLQFDYKILSTYTDTDLGTLPNFDMLSKIEQTLNFRVSRDNLAHNTLRNSKNSKSLSTLKNRVDITKELFKHGCKEGHLSYYNNRFGTKEVCNTSSWADTARSITDRKYPLTKTQTLNENDATENSMYPITPPNSKSPGVQSQRKPTAKGNSNTQHKDQFSKASARLLNAKLNGEEILRCYQETLQCYETDAYYDPIGFTYDKMKDQLDLSISHQEFKNALIELYPERKYNYKNYKNRIFCSHYTYIDPSGTLAFERVRDYIDIRNIKEELARGI